MVRGFAFRIFEVRGSGFRVRVMWLRGVLGSGIGVSGQGYAVWDFPCSGFCDSGFGFGVSGTGFGVEGFRGTDF